MESLITLFFALVAILSICYITSPNMILTPQFGFVVGFVPGVFYAFWYIDTWGIDLAPQTVLTILTGISVFSLVSIVMMFKNNGGKIRFIGNPLYRNHDLVFLARDKIIKVDSWKLYPFIIINIVTFIIQIQFLGGLNLGNIFVSMAAYRADVLTGSGLYENMPSYVQWLKLLCNAACYLWLYILINNLMYKHKKNRLLLFVLIILGILNTVISGGRSFLIIVVISALVQTYFIWEDKIAWKKVFSMKSLFIAFAIFAIFVTIFQGLGTLQGRTSSETLGEYIAIYMSAEIQNFDSFVRSGNGGNADINSYQTMFYIINWLSIKLGTDWYHNLDLPFHVYKGHWAGNVSTTFYAFYYDFGIMGVIVFSALMAWISQKVFYRAMKPAKRGNSINISVVLYSYMFFSLVFSFFSNKFYEMFFNITFVQMFIIWMLLKIFLEGFSLVEGRSGVFRIKVRGIRKGIKTNGYGVK